MRRIFTKALTMGSLLIVFAMFTATGSAQGQSLANRITVNIPFDFVVGKKTLPAGEYSVRSAQPNSGDSVLSISSKDSRVNVFGFTTAVQSPTFTDRGKLVFHRYGDQYFLFQIWSSGTTTGRALAKSRAERDLERKARIAAAVGAQKVSVETVPISVQ